MLRGSQEEPRGKPTFCGLRALQHAGSLALLSKNQQSWRCFEYLLEANKTTQLEPFKLAQLWKADMEDFSVTNGEPERSTS